MSSFRELDQALTAPGQYFEIEARDVGQRHLRVWKNAPRTLRDVFLAGQQFGDRVYIGYQGETLSYAEHARQVGALARALVSTFGIRQGDRVALAMRNYPEWPVAFWAVSTIGAVIVPVNAWLTERELRHVIGDCGARLLIADRQRAESVAPWMRETALEAIVVARGDGRLEGVHDFAELVRAGVDATLPAAEIGPDDDATIFYTSGTTGLPKGAVGTQRNICSSVFAGGYMVLRTLIRRGGKPEDMALMAQHPQTGLLTVPFFHVTGCVGGLINMYSGGGRLLLMHKWDPLVALELIERERVNFFVGVPTLAWQLLEHPEAGKHDLSSLNSIAFGGAAAAPELYRRLRDSLPNAAPSTGYGITETSATIAAFGGSDYGRRPDAAGAPLPVCEFRFVDSDGRDVASGALGEIWVRGQKVLLQQGHVAGKSLFQSPGLKGKAIGSSYTDRWRSAHYHIFNGETYIIKAGGNRVSAKEIEDVVLEIAGAVETAVIGVPDEVLGEAIKAFVVRCHATLTEEDVKGHLQRRLPAFKHPKWVEFREELPKNQSGKIL
ncbi:MAG TPA: class I adenylate-forming enzyme family protein, partial [Pseudomonadales bacterium]|nr:class I adenylate-forming enzyme family protein [Pseudomonadales bacterium]